VHVRERALVVGLHFERGLERFAFLGASTANLDGSPDVRERAAAARFAHDPLDVVLVVLVALERAGGRSTARIAARAVVHGAATYHERRRELAFGVAEPEFT